MATPTDREIENDFNDLEEHVKLLEAELNRANQHIAIATATIKGLNAVCDSYESEVTRLQGSQIKCWFGFHDDEVKDVGQYTSTMLSRNERDVTLVLLVCKRCQAPHTVQLDGIWRLDQVKPR